MLEHSVIDRKTGQVFIEKTFGENWIEWAYKSRAGRAFTGNLLFQKTISAFVGAFMKTPFSRSRIQNFVRDFEINMGDYSKSINEFESFNDFFVRQLRPNARSFPKEKNQLGCPAEGRVSVYELSSLETPLYFKGQKVSLQKVLGGSEALANEFLGGWAFVIRLCPVDYHRFHFADSGATQAAVPMTGLLESVNPLSLYLNSQVFAENVRELTLQKSEHFGLLAYVEVGALCVGSIQQTFDARGPISRGQEKGYFEFGGSTQILFIQKQLQVASDLLENSQKELETLVRLGECIATKK